jgi:hypothetical protein
VLDSGCTNHITVKRRMFTSFEKIIVQVIASRSVIIAKEKFLDSVKLLSQPNIQSLKFIL